MNIHAPIRGSYVIITVNRPAAVARVFSVFFPVDFFLFFHACTLARIVLNACV